MACGDASSVSTDGNCVANSLANDLGKVSLDSSPILPSKHLTQQHVTSLRPARNYSLRELEIMSTIGTGTFGRVILVRDLPTSKYYALKVMNIAEVIRLKQVQHVQSEKEILMSVSHPFIVNLNWTHHDERFLYMLLDYVCGGELFAYLRASQRFNNDMAIFYTSEIVMALDYLHSQNIVYRDLKPENILLDIFGHLRITDFGFAKRLQDKRTLTYTLCGTPEYLAPEIITGRGHSKGVDWWALGILIFEMLIGYPPYFDEHPFRIYEKILNSRVEYPRILESSAKDIIKRLLTHDTTKRLGCMRNGIDDVRSHKWFKAIEWDAVFQRKIKPPIIPHVTHPGDTQNFDKYPEDGWLINPKMAHSTDLELFKDF